MNANDLITAHQQLKEQKTELKRQFDAQVADIDAKLEKVLAGLNKIMNEQGVSNIKGDAGLAYYGTKTSASVADWDLFLNWAIENDRKDLIGRHCSKDAVVAYKEEHDDTLPPGINWYAEKELRIRRA